MKAWTPVLAFGMTIVALPVCLTARAQAGVGPQIATQREAHDEAQHLGPVARVLNRWIFAEDLEYSTRWPAGGWHPSVRERTLHRWEVLHTTIQEPLWDRYCHEHHLTATPDEVEKYVVSSGLGFPFNMEALTKQALDHAREELASTDLKVSDRRELVEFVKFMDNAEGSFLERNEAFMRSKLDNPDLTDNERAEIVESMRQWAEVLEQAAEASKAFRSKAAAEIRRWKFHKALYAEHGGTVITSPISYGHEPIDALRIWLTAHEKAGRFEILDPKLKRDFWLYYRQNWADGRHVVRDRAPLEKPRLLMQMEDRDDADGPWWVD